MRPAPKAPHRQQVRYDSKQRLDQERKRHPGHEHRALSGGKPQSVFEQIRNRLIDDPAHALGEIVEDKKKIDTVAFHRFMASKLSSNKTSAGKARQSWVTTSGPGVKNAELKKQSKEICRRSFTSRERCRMPIRVRL